MGMTHQLSAMSKETSSGHRWGGREGGASLLRDRSTTEQKNPFDGSPYSSWLNQLSPVLPTLISNSNCGIIMGTTNSDPSSRQLLGNRPSELNAALNDRVHQRLPEITWLAKWEWDWNCSARLWELRKHDVIGCYWSWCRQRLSILTLQFLSFGVIPHEYCSWSLTLENVFHNLLQQLLN